MRDNGKKPPSALVLPFGKHKGATVAEVLTKDPSYADWILNQGWVAERFAELHAAIMSRGATPDDSPEHNAIQVRFLEDEFQLACLMAAFPNLLDQRKEAVRQFRRQESEVMLGIAKRNYRSYQENLAIRPDWTQADWEQADAWLQGRWRNVQSAKQHLTEMERRRAAVESNFVRVNLSVRFEQRGVDVVLNCNFEAPFGFGATIEIKPTMGDDFPSVMRQMERLKCKVLVVGQYTGRAVSEPQLRKMFEVNGLTLLFVRDIEAELPNARAELAP